MANKHGNIILFQGSLYFLHLLIEMKIQSFIQLTGTPKCRTWGSHQEGRLPPCSRKLTHFIFASMSFPLSTKYNANNVHFGTSTPKCDLANVFLKFVVSPLAEPVIKVILQFSQVSRLVDCSTNT